MSTHD